MQQPNFSDCCIFSRVLRQSDYLFSVLLNGLITGYMSVAAAISDGLEELESALLADTGDRVWW